MTIFDESFYKCTSGNIAKKMFMITLNAKAQKYFLSYVPLGDPYKRLPGWKMYLKTGD